MIRRTRAPEEDARAGDTIAGGRRQMLELEQQQTLFWALQENGLGNSGGTAVLRVEDNGARLSVGYQKSSETASVTIFSLAKSSGSVVQTGGIPVTRPGPRHLLETLVQMALDFADEFHADGAECRVDTKILRWVKEAEDDDAEALAKAERAH